MDKKLHKGKESIKFFFYEKYGNILLPELN